MDVDTASNNRCHEALSARCKTYVQKRIATASPLRWPPTDGVRICRPLMQTTMLSSPTKHNTESPLMRKIFFLEGTPSAGHTICFADVGRRLESAHNDEAERHEQIVDERDVHLSIVLHMRHQKISQQQVYKGYKRSSCQETVKPSEMLEAQVGSRKAMRDSLMAATNKSDSMAARKRLPAPFACSSNANLLKPAWHDKRKSLCFPLK